MNYLNKRYINLYIILVVADADLFIIHWRQSKRGKSMHHEEISQRHININTLQSTTIISLVHFLTPQK